MQTIYILKAYDSHHPLTTWWPWITKITKFKRFTLSSSRTQKLCYNIVTVGYINIEHLDRSRLGFICVHCQNIHSLQSLNLCYHPPEQRPNYSRPADIRGLEQRPTQVQIQPVSCRDDRQCVQSVVGWRRIHCSTITRGPKNCRKGTKRGPNFWQKWDPKGTLFDVKGDLKFEFFRIVHKERIC